MYSITRYRHRGKKGLCYRLTDEAGNVTLFLELPEILILYLRKMGVPQELADRALGLKIGETYSVLTIEPDDPENEPPFELPGEFPA